MPDAAVEARRQLDHAAALAAYDKWHVVAETPFEHVRYVDAEAGTGSRYTVVASRLPDIARVMLSAPVHVSVVYPWRASYELQDRGYLAVSYLLEKLGKPGREPSLAEYHWGDVVALALTVGHLLFRPVEPLRDLGVPIGGRE